MTEKTMRYCVIRFTDGTSLKFKFAGDEVQDVTDAATRIQNILDARTLALELDGQLMIIPMSNIRAIEVVPSFEKLPERFIKATTVN